MKRIICLLSAMPLLWSLACVRHHPEDHIKSIRTISENFASGPKVTAAVVEYQHAVKDKQLDSLAFVVDGRKVKNVYANTTGQRGGGRHDGRFVIIELDSSSNVPTTAQNVHQVYNLETPDGRRFEASDNSMPFSEHH